MTSKPVQRGAALAMLLALAAGGCTLLPDLSEAPSLPPSAMTPAYTQFRLNLDVEARSIAACASSSPSQMRVNVRG